MEKNMFKFVHLFKHYFFGLSFIGIAAFVIQEIPYMIMPLIKPESNPIMNMQNEIKWIETVQGLLGILSMILLMLIVLSQFAVVPLYYLFFGLWKSNYLLVGVAVPFFLIHTINGVLNFTIKK